MKNYPITGSLIEAYIFCPRQAWLMSRQITGNQYNEFLAIGRLISGESYKREKREILIDGGKIDFIKEKNGKMLIVEVKKSSKFMDTAKMQLLYYLYKFRKKGYDIRGELRIPKEKKVFEVEFEEKEEKMIEQIINEIEDLLVLDIPPKIKFNPKCRQCSYKEFCWS